MEAAHPLPKNQKKKKNAGPSPGLEGLFMGAYTQTVGRIQMVDPLKGEE